LALEKVLRTFSSDLIGVKVPGKAGSPSQGGLRCMLFRAVLEKRSPRVFSAG
jgi:hypothetical protein